MKLHLAHTAAADRDLRCESVIEVVRSFGDYLCMELGDDEAAAHVYNALIDLKRARRECVVQRMDAERLAKVRS